MSAKHPRRRSPRKRRADGSVAMRLARVETQLARLTRAQVNVRRDEFTALAATLHTVQQNADALDVQFKRIAQIQADLDAIKKAWTDAKTLP
jgi:hypothetical protein